jgi:hypothetical protein
VFHGSDARWEWSVRGRAGRRRRPAEVIASYAQWQRLARRAASARLRAGRAVEARRARRSLGVAGAAAARGGAHARAAEASAAVARDERPWVQRVLYAARPSLPAEVEALDRGAHGRASDAALDACGGAPDVAHRRAVGGLEPRWHRARAWRDVVDAPVAVVVLPVARLGDGADRRARDGSKRVARRDRPPVAAALLAGNRAGCAHRWAPNAAHAVAQLEASAALAGVGGALSRAAAHAARASEAHVAFAALPVALAARPARPAAGEVGARVADRAALVAARARGRSLVAATASHQAARAARGARAAKRRGVRRRRAAREALEVAARAVAALLAASNAAPDVVSSVAQAGRAGLAGAARLRVGCIRPVPVAGLSFTSGRGARASEVREQRRSVRARRRAAVGALDAGVSWACGQGGVARDAPEQPRSLARAAAHAVAGRVDDAREPRAAHARSDRGAAWVERAVCALFGNGAALVDAHPELPLRARDRSAVRSARSGCARRSAVAVRSHAHRGESDRRQPCCDARHSCGAFIARSLHSFIERHSSHPSPTNPEGSCRCPHPM